MNIDLTLLDNLSEEEKKVALEILNQYKENGQSELLDNLKYQDYSEIPVTIEEFLHNPIYLGSGLTFLLI